MKQTLQKIKSVIMELHTRYPMRTANPEPYVSRRRVIEEIDKLEKELRYLYDAHNHQVCLCQRCKVLKEILDE